MTAGVVRHAKISRAAWCKLRTVCEGLHHDGYQMFFNLRNGYQAHFEPDLSEITESPSQRLAFSKALDNGVVLVITALTLSLVFLQEITGRPAILAGSLGLLIIAPTVLIQTN